MEDTGKINDDIYASLQVFIRATITLSMAMSLPPDGKVVACDITDEYMNKVQSQRYFKEVSQSLIWRIIVK